MTIEQCRLYLVAPARLAVGPLHELIGELSAAGVDVVQLREKEMEAGDVLRAAAPLVEACVAAGITFIVNDRPDIALALGCGVHVGQNDLPPGVARRIVPDAVVGTSTHSRAEIDSVADAVDYIAVGPVYETPTKPGRAAVGIELVRYAARRATVPWFAIGGIDAGNVDEVVDAGARRIVVVRAITQAADPAAAAAALRERLDAVPLTTA